jgi:hypothetical protein
LKYLKGQIDLLEAKAAANEKALENLEGFFKKLSLKTRIEPEPLVDGLYLKQTILQPYPFEANDARKGLPLPPPPDENNNKDKNQNKALTKSNEKIYMKQCKLYSEPKAKNSDIEVIKLTIIF